MRDLFIRFRRSNAFLASLTVFSVTWLGAHWVLGFDGDLSLLNIALSFEASFATCILLDQTLKMGAADRERWDRIEEILLGLKVEVQEIEEELEETFDTGQVADTE